jgi:hypothetical protein
MIFIMIEARGVVPATWKGVSLRMVVDLVLGRMAHEGSKERSNFFLS